MKEKPEKQAGLSEKHRNCLENAPKGETAQWLLAMEYFRLRGKKWRQFGIFWRKYTINYTMDKGK